MISQSTVMTSQISESEKEDRSSMEIVIIESPPFVCPVNIPRRANCNPSKSRKNRKKLQIKTHLPIDSVGK